MQDAFAILLAAHHPRINLLGVSTVFGNAPLSKTTLNAGALLTAIGKHDEIPLHVGADKPLERPAHHPATEIHGESGLDGTDLLPKPARAPSDVPAVEAMVKALKAQPPNTAWIVATGSLTNVGQLFREHPDLASHVKGVSLMGGSIGDGFTDAPMGEVDGKPRIGNYTPYAEFNILIDPEAASEIFSNEALEGKVSVVALDLSHQVLATDDVRQLLLCGRDGTKRDDGKGKTVLRQMLVELLYFFAQTYAYVPLLTTLRGVATLTRTEIRLASRLAHHCTIPLPWHWS